jgi:phospholipase C
MIRRVLFALFLALVVGADQFGWAQAAPGGGSNETKTPIQHLIVLMQENHTFDNYFGTYPGVDGLPADTSMPVDPNNPAAGTVQPWHIGNSTITDLSHTAPTFRGQYNNGKMDGFVSYLNSINQKGLLSMGYYNGEDIPYYWNLADEFVLFDRFFSSSADGSFPNHMYWVAGQSPQALRGQKLADVLANVPTIFDRLQAAGVSWKFYVENYDPSITYRNQAAAGNRASQIIWVPLLNYDRFIDDPVLTSHIVDLSQYYTDLEQGTLPSVAYIVPSGASEHPPQKPVTGERTVKNLIQELMRSTSWDSSAFLLLYDDWGGWYDHVTPPQVDNFGYGFRVPALLISPYSKKGHVDHTQLDFTSILKFIEENWNVQPLASRDAAASNFLGAFDFTQPPRAPEFLPSIRTNTAVVKKDPSRIIYTTYGFAVLLSIVVLGTAYIRHFLAKPGTVENYNR